MLDDGRAVLQGGPGRRRPGAELRHQFELQRPVDLRVQALPLGLHRDARLPGRPALRRERPPLLRLPAPRKRRTASSTPIAPVGKCARSTRSAAIAARRIPIVSATKPACREAAPRKASSATAASPSCRRTRRPRAATLLVQFTVPRPAHLPQQPLPGRVPHFARLLGRKAVRPEPLPGSRVPRDRRGLRRDLSFNTDCPAPLVCKSGTCTCECRFGGDCPAGYDCNANRCTVGGVGSVGADGGTLASADGRLTLVIPPGALPFPVSIGIEAAEAWPEGALGPVFEVRPSGTLFAKPVTFVYRYQADDIAPVAATDVRLAVGVVRPGTGSPRRVNAEMKTGNNAGDAPVDVRSRRTSTGRRGRRRGGVQWGRVQRNGARQLLPARVHRCERFRLLWMRQRARRARRDVRPARIVPVVRRPERLHHRHADRQRGDLHLELRAFGEDLLQRRQRSLLPDGLHGAERLGLRLLRRRRRRSRGRRDVRPAGHLSDGVHARAVLGGENAHRIGGDLQRALLDDAGCRAAATRPTGVAHRGAIRHPPTATSTARRPAATASSTPAETCDPLSTCPMSCPQSRAARCARLPTAGPARRGAKRPARRPRA